VTDGQLNKTSISWCQQLRNRTAKR